MARAPLRLKADGTFTVMQLADTHFWDAGWRDAKTSALITTLLSFEKPDFIAHTGDAVHASLVKDSPAAFMERWNHMVSLFNGTPYAVTLGNHDQDEEFSNIMNILQNDQTHAYCYSRKMDGVEPYNYYVDVLDAAGNAPAWRLWFFNSGKDGGWCENERSAGCVPSDIVSWAYTNGCNETLPSLVFSHIPIAAVLATVNRTGTRQDNSPIPAVNTGLDSFAVRCGARAMTFGHMHGNDFMGTYARNLPGRGPAAALYGYGRNSGYGYQGAGDLQRGARMFKIKADGAVETWIRQEDGTRVDYDRYHNKWHEQARAWIVYMCLIALGVVLFTFIISLFALHYGKGAKYTYTRLRPTKN